MAKGGVIITASLIGSWIGAALNGGNWFGWISTIFGLVGLAVGYWLAKLLDNYIEN